jgi:branched-chain amino acid transport system substrate-binding protein
VPYPLEAKAFVDYLTETKPDATVAILRANDDFGRAYVDTFERLIEGTDITVVQEETYNVEQFDTKAQITSLAATDADALFLGATLLACPDALGNVVAADWDPIIYMSGTCTSKTLMTIAASRGAGDGVFSVIPLIDPVDPANASNEQVALYREKVGQYAPDADPDNAIVAYGWSTAALLADLLSKSPAADRVSVMETAREYEVSGVALMPDGVTFRTGADDWFLGETFQLVQYDGTGGFFASVGDITDEDGKTAEYTPEDLING